MIIVVILNGSKTVFACQTVETKMLRHDWKMKRTAEQTHDGTTERVYEEKRLKRVHLTFHGGRIQRVSAEGPERRNRLVNRSRGELVRGRGVKYTRKWAEPITHR